MTRREWTVDDRFGRTWRLVVEGRGGTANGRGVMRDLVDASLTGPPDRSDAVAETLFAVAAAVGREDNAYDAWLRLPFDDASRLAEDVRVELVRASEVGALIAEPVQRAIRLHHDPEEPPASEPPPEPETDDWIAIELVDDDGSPHAGVEYRIEGPSGEIYTGTTDAKGKARIAGIQPGECKVSFPKLHEPDWKAVG